MMIKIELVTQAPSMDVLWATGVYEETSAGVVPPITALAMEQKPHSPIIETLFMKDEHAISYVMARLGAKGHSTRQSREEAGVLLKKKIDEGIAKEIVVDIRHLEEDGLELLTGILLAHYRFHPHKSQLKPGEKPSIEKIFLLCLEPLRLIDKLEKLQAVVEGVYYARNLTSEPSNVLFPTAYAERLQELTEIGVDVEVLDEKQLTAIGMTAILAVGQGSSRESSVVILKWNGLQNQDPPILVVGKGVCFDSGGICLKEISHQYCMKWDKAGAGVVAGLIKALALSKAPVNIVGVLGLVENMPDGNAIKPGDVIKTMSGQTVEIVNTDAEGRLVLADCLWYAQKRFQPKLIIDLGTLTMETFSSLGTAYAGLYTDHYELEQELKAAGEMSGDLLWKLPMGSYFARQIESSVADMKNIGVEFWGENGAAAEFLKRFITSNPSENRGADVKIPWAHIDIAGVSWAKEEDLQAGKGVTGFGVRLLTEWIFSKCS